MYVVESLGGGVITYLKQLSDNLCNDFDITILYGIRDQTPANLESIFDEKVKLTEIKNFQRSVSVLGDFKAYKEIKSNIDMISPDIVHLNSSKAGALGRILKFMHSRKYKNLDFYYTPHGYAFLMLDEPK